MNEQLIKAYEKETHTSFRDSLTGLFNHGVFQVLLDEAINRAQRYGDLFTLALIDIDSFSSYNKQHRPVLGDKMLKKVAKCIKENLREPDIASRYSGDVFAVLLPKASARGAYIAVERIRNSVQTDTQGSLTVSAGLASCPIDASNKGTLILRAKEVLLKAGVPREILNKPVRLDPDEWEVLKGHPDAAYKICLPLEKTLGHALDAIRHHHERLDGSGYPDGLKGDEVSILARIIAAVDIFDALNTDRPYRKRMPREKTMKVLRQEAEEGKLDKVIVEHLLELLGPI